MSLDNASHPGRPGLDELVPSRYAVEVGEIDVLVVSDGVLSLPTKMLAHNVDPAVRAAWLEDMFLPPEMLSRSGSTAPTGTTASNTTPRTRPAFGSVFCGSWRRPASRWWPLTCRSRPSAMWRSPATSFVGYRPSGITDRLLG